MLHTKELAARLQEEFITVNCLHPGVVNTHFLRNVSGIFGSILKLFFSFQLTPKEGAKTSVFLALDSSVEGLTGGYYADSRKIASSPEGSDAEKAKKLWNYTEEQLKSFL